MRWNICEKNFCWKIRTIIFLFLNSSLMRLQWEVMKQIKYRVCFSGAVSRQFLLPSKDENDQAAGDDHKFTARMWKCVNNDDKSYVYFSGRPAAPPANPQVVVVDPRVAAEPQVGRGRQVAAPVMPEVWNPVHRLPGRRTSSCKMSRENTLR